MFGIKVSSMQELQNPTDQAKIPVVQNGRNYSVTIKAIKSILTFPTELIESIKKTLTQLVVGVNNLNKITTDLENNKANKEDIPKNIATTEDLQKYQPKGNYLTEHQDISNLATTKALNDSVTNLTNSIPKKVSQLENDSQCRINPRILFNSQKIYFNSF